MEPSFRRGKGVGLVFKSDINDAKKSSSDDLPPPVVVVAMDGGTFGIADRRWLVAGPPISLFKSDINEEKKSSAAALLLVSGAEDRGGGSRAWLGGGGGVDVRWLSRGVTDEPTDKSWFKSDMSEAKKSSDGLRFDWSAATSFPLLLLLFGEVVTKALQSAVRS